MKGKFYLTIYLLIAIPILSMAQNRLIKGKVSDENGLGLPGVSILLKGSTSGFQSDVDGNFQISVPSETRAFVFSFVGYEKKEVLIGDQTTLNVQLAPLQNNLEEVVVIGYGSQKLTKVSGSIATVKSAEIQKLNPVRAEDALQGRASGVTVISPGTPGAKPTVLIRGIPSYSGTDPVVIVDGSIQTLDDLNSISAADIASINVLKDAATTAIYGVKGGNGVIVVTTKSGKKNQKTEFNFSSSLGVQQVLNQLGVTNASEYAALVNEGSLSSGGGIIFSDIASLGLGTNWQEQVFETPIYQTHTLSARGGSDKMNYFISGGYLGQGGIVGGSDKSYFNRLNGTINLDFDLTKRLKFIANTSFVNIKGAGIPENSINSVLSNSINFDPTVPVFNNVPGTVGRYSFSNNILSEIFNPLTQLENTYNNSNTNKFYGKLELQYKLMDNLQFTARYGYTNTDVTSKAFNPLVFYGPSHINSTLNSDGSARIGVNNSVYQEKTTYFNYTLEQFINYNKTFGENHHFDAILGFSLAKVTGNSINGSRQDVPFNSWDYADISAATGIAPNSGISLANFRYERRNLSYFSRFNYDYKETYLASLSARRDGSFAFGANNKFANFYAGSVGWVLSNEDFFQSNFINYFKIRASYGITGNENVSPQIQRISTEIYSYNLGQNAGYTFGDLPTSIGSTVISFKNDDLGWEKQRQLNAGFDMDFLDGKFSLTADYFEKNISGLLFTPSLSLYLGTAAAPSANIGTTKTSGFDLNFGYNNQFGKNWNIRTNLTLTHAKNLVTNTNNGVIFGGYYGIPTQTVTRFETGYSPGYFFGFKTDGLFQTIEEISASATQPNAQPGDIKYVDINQDGVINDADRTKIGDPFPQFTVGHSLTISFKNLDLTTFLYASIGNDIYRAYDRNLAMTNKPRSILARWTGPGTTNDARYPRYSFVDGNNNTRPSDRYVEDGSFLKVKNIQLGYTLPNKFLKTSAIQSFRVFAQVKNAFTFTRYSGFDPEISGGILDTGIDRAAYPQARTFLVGLDIRF